MLRDKKAQGLSMNVIIIAAIALLVMVILAVIFTTKMRDTRGQIDSCVSNGGDCVQTDFINEPGDSNFCSGTYDRVRSEYSCPDPDTQSCCFRG
ncbi:hypothetical protein GOV05_03890 [Candidatus Woesearchaeota archaeon]|nr:hypothetical protein [Candidatus Woesearchaeota archaeon]